MLTVECCGRVRGSSEDVSNSQWAWIGKEVSMKPDKKLAEAIARAQVPCKPKRLPVLPKRKP